MKVAALSCLAIALALPAFSQPVTQPAVNPAILQADRLSEPWWAERHAAVLEAVRSRPATRLLLIGDSITHNYDKSTPPDENFQPVWQEFYAPRAALNLGFSGDTTANVLWRLDHGELEGLHPKLVVLLIGTNNTGHADQSAAQTTSGIDAVVADLERHLPETRILLLGILPSDISTAKTERDRSINEALARTYGEDLRVTYLDISSIFYRNGALRTDLFYDPRLLQPGKSLHPDSRGQRMMAEAIEPTVARLMGEAPRVALASMTDINTALIPVERLELDSYDWYQRHHAVLQLRKRLNPRVVLIGDSITHFWGGPPAANHVNGAAAWQRVFGPLPALNLGFGWDRTQNVLWRLQQGELDGLRPRWVIINIGTNNLTGTSNARPNTPEETVEGIRAVCDEVRKRVPQSRIIVMAIFPRGAQPSDFLRTPIRNTNRLLANRYAGDPQVIYLDIGTRFLTVDGSLPASAMPDGTHPSNAGYQIWANALIETGVRP